MPIGEICTRQTVVAPQGTSVHQAVKLMRQYHVGDLIVTDHVNGKPIGIVTDRDIVIEILAQDLDPSGISVDEIMSQDLVVVQEREGVFETVEKMRVKGVRRMPVVNVEGNLVGIVAVDDLIEILAEELGALAKLISREQKHEAELRM